MQPSECDGDIERPTGRVRPVMWWSSLLLQNLDYDSVGCLGLRLRHDLTTRKFRFNDRLGML